MVNFTKHYIRKGEIMNGETLWNIIILGLESSGEEIHTKRGLWFRALSHDGRLYVNRATDNTPSSRLSMQRLISKKDFLFVNSYYDRWISKEAGVRQEVIKKSENATYIFAIIGRLSENK